MATRDNFDASLARLTSLDGRFLLTMDLQSLSSWPHGDWLSYELHMFIDETGERASLVPDEERGLFLDRVVEPEVPALCQGIRRVLTEGGRYAFTPIDEGDFMFSVERRDDGFLVEVQFRFVHASSRFGWPEGILVAASELSTFAESLEIAALRIEGEHLRSDRR